jgi:hypothetical protein
VVVDVDRGIVLRKDLKVGAAVSALLGDLKLMLIVLSSNLDRLRQYQATDEFK